MVTSTQGTRKPKENMKPPKDDPKATASDQNIEGYYTPVSAHEFDGGDLERRAERLKAKFDAHKEVTSLKRCMKGVIRSVLKLRGYEPENIDSIFEEADNSSILDLVRNHGELFLSHEALQESVFQLQDIVKLLKEQLTIQEDSRRKSEVTEASRRNELRAAVEVDGDYGTTKRYYEGRVSPRRCDGYGQQRSPQREQRYGSPIIFDLSRAKARVG